MGVSFLDTQDIREKNNRHQAVRIYGRYNQTEKTLTVNNQYDFLQVLTSI